MNQRFSGGGGPWQQSGILEPTQGSVGTPQWDSITSVQRGGEEGVDEGLCHGGSEGLESGRVSEGVHCQSVGGLDVLLKTWYLRY